jgi:hypothetical protein
MPEHHDMEVVENTGNHEEPNRDVPLCINSRITKLPFPLVLILHKGIHAEVRFIVHENNANCIERCISHNVRMCVSK